MTEKLFAHVVNGRVRAVERVSAKTKVDDTMVDTVPGQHVFTAEYAKELVPCSEAVKEGFVYRDGTFSEPEPEPWKVKDLADYVRGQRDQRLTACDWTQIPDAPISEAKREAWRIYRQELRDLPKTLKGLRHSSEVAWPEAPSA